MSLIEGAKNERSDLSHLPSLMANPVTLRFSKQSLVRDVQCALERALTEQLSAKSFRNALQSNLVSSALSSDLNDFVDKASRSGLDDSGAHPATSLASLGVPTGAAVPMYSKSRARSSAAAAAHGFSMASPQPATSKETFDSALCFPALTVSLDTVVQAASGSAFGYDGDEYVRTQVA